MDAHDVYLDSDEDVYAKDSDGDDDYIKLVPSKRKYRYTTFGDEDENDENQENKDEATYGIFLNSSDKDKNRSKRFRSRGAGAGAPMFVKAKTANDDDNEKQRQPSQKQQTQTSHFVRSGEQQHRHDDEEEDDEEDKLAVEKVRKEQAEANAKFNDLLRRAKGQATSQSFSTSHNKESNENGSNEYDGAPGLGLGFTTPSNYNNNNVAGLGTNASAVGLPRTFGGASQSMNPPIVSRKMDPNLGKWEKYTKGFGSKMLAKMGYKGSGGLGGHAAKKSQQVSSSVASSVSHQSQQQKDQQPKAESRTPAKTGISRPIEVVVRPANLGLGFGSFREASQLAVNKKLHAEMQGKEIKTNKKGNDEQDDDEGGPQLHASASLASSALPSTKDIMQQQAWRKHANVKRKRKRKTIEATPIVPYQEMLKQHQQTKIIDMRSPQQQQDPDLSTLTTIPLGEELLHNISVLLSTNETKLHSTSHFLRSAEQKVASMESDILGMETKQTAFQDRISKMKQVQNTMNEIDKLVVSVNLNRHSPEYVDTKNDVAKQVLGLVNGLRNVLSKEDQAALEFDQVLVPSLLSPLIQSRIHDWHPLKDSPETTLEFLSSLLHLGANKDMGGDFEETTILKRKQSILNQNVMPRVKTVYESVKWDPVQHVDTGIMLYETLIKFLEQEQQEHEFNDKEEQDVNVLPSVPGDTIQLVDNLRHGLLHGTIFPKLMRYMNQWKPQVNESTGKEQQVFLVDPMHQWLLPWMVHLNHPSVHSELAPELKRKLRAGLSLLSKKVKGDDNNEHFLKAAYSILRPWAPILKQGTIQDLTNKYMTSRLVKSLSSMEIQILQPNKQQWRLVDLCLEMYANGLFAFLDFASLVEGEVLMNVISSLYKVLATHNDRNQITPVVLATLYRGWKEKFLTVAILQEDELICRMFYTILHMIHSFLKAKPTILRPRTTHNYTRVLLLRQQLERDRAEQAMDKMESRDTLEFRKRLYSRRHGGSATFRDVVQEFAQENDILFRPKSLAGSGTTHHDGKPIFLFGKASIYYDQDVVFFLDSEKGQWRPVSLEELLAQAR